jgi:type IV secretion system protein TrbL
MPFLSKKSLHKALLTLTLLSGLFALLAPEANAAGVFDTFQSSFYSLSQGWFGKAQTYANHIFYMLLTVDFVWLALTWVLTRKTFDEMLPSFIRKVMVYGFFLMLVVNAGTFLPAIINSFTDMGTNIAGVPSLTPSTLVNTGNALAYGIVTGDYSAVQKYVPGATVPAAPAQPAGSSSSGTACKWYTLCLNKAVNAVGDTISSALTKIEFFLIALIFAGITWIAFLLMAVDLLITLIESYVVLGVGVIFLGFGASRWTTKFADGILNYAVSVGVKLLMLYLVIGALITAVLPTVVSQLMANAQSGDGALNSLLLGGAGVVLMLMLSKSIPSKAQSLLSGAAALGAAHAIQEVTNSASSGKSAAGLGARGVLGTAAGAAGLSKGVSGVYSKIAGGSIGSGGSGGGAGVSAPISNAGKAAGQGVAKAGQAAGQGIAAGGKAAGSAIAAIPIPVVAQAAGAAVSAAGQVAGKGVEMAGQAAGKGVEVAGKAAGTAAQAAQATGRAGFQATKDAAQTTSGGGSGPQGTESGKTAAPLRPAEEAPKKKSTSVLGSGQQGMQQAARAAGMLTQHNGGAVQAGHIGTGHGND